MGTMGFELFELFGFSGTALAFAVLGIFGVDFGPATDAAQRVDQP